MALKFCPQCETAQQGDLAYCPFDGHALSDAPDPYIGRTIAGRYSVQEKLGMGGMASVYRARHKVIGRDVALKFLNPDKGRLERQRRRFLGEARAANQIHHDHIIDISDYGETDDGIVYMVMEYLQGQTLEEELDKNGPLPLGRALRIAQQVASGLARAHEFGVVHRDVKPSNVFLVDRDGYDFVKLLDFGIARIEQDMRITAQGAIVGTPEYIAPEQIRSAAATAATDLYALGCVLFEMLTARLPFEGGMTVLLIKHLNEVAPAPSTLREGIPPVIDAIVLKLLDKDPQLRFRDALELARALEEVLSQLPPAPRTHPQSAMAAQRALKASRAPSWAVPPPTLRNWDEVLRGFEQMAAAACPSRPLPPHVKTPLERLRRKVAELSHLRQALTAAATYATRVERETREPRSQLSAALDELEQDASVAGSRVAQLQATIDEQQASLAACIDALSATATAVPQPLSHPVEAPSVSALAEVLTGVSRAQESLGRLRKTQRELQAAESGHADLAFQMTQLKAQLDGLHRSSTLEQDVAQDRVRRADAAAKAKISEVQQAAATLTALFRHLGAPQDELDDQDGQKYQDDPDGTSNEPPVRPGPEEVASN